MDATACCEAVARPDLTDWIAVDLGAIGGTLALVASWQGIRMKHPNEAFQAGTTQLWIDLRKTSRVLFVGSLAVLTGVAIQVVQLVGRY